MTTEPIGPLTAAALYGVARSLTSATTSAAVAGDTFRFATDELGASSTGLWLLRDGSIRFVAGRGVGEKGVETVGDIPLDSTLPAAECLRERSPVLYGSGAERDHRWPQLVGVSTLDEATAVMPLVVPDGPDASSGRTLGCLHVGFPRAMPVEDIDVDLLSRLAELCAAALDRALLYDAEMTRRQLLLDVAAAAAGSGGLAVTLERLARAAVPALGDICLIDVTTPRGGISRVAAVHADPAAEPLMRELLESYPPRADGTHPAVTVVAEGRSVWAADMPDEFLRATTRDDRHFELVRQLGFRSFVSAPLTIAGAVLGAVSIISAGSGRRFGPAEAALAEELAARASEVVVTARRAEHEHTVAHTLQRLLLPHSIPDMPGLEVAARYRTADSEAEAGGDFYDTVVLPSGRVGIVIGDVEGHDMEAAATMGQLRSAIRALAGQYRSPSAVLDSLRWSYELIGFTRMATVLLGRIDPVSGDFVFTSAGHMAPLRIGVDGAVALVPSSAGPPLGVPAAPAVEEALCVEPGEGLLFYTDGLIEAWPGSVDSQLEALREFVASHLGEGEPADLDRLCDDLMAAGGPGRRRDDVAILAVRRSQTAPG